MYFYKVNILFSYCIMNQNNIIETIEFIYFNNKHKISIIKNILEDYAIEYGGL